MIQAVTVRGVLPLLEYAPHLASCVGSAFGNDITAYMRGGGMYFGDDACLADVQQFQWQLGTTTLATFLSEGCICVCR